MNMNLMRGKGLSTTRMLDLVMNTLYERFVENDVKEFDGFDVGILDTFNTINMALPGKHYVSPSHKDVKDLFEQWEKANKEQKKKMFSDFINKNVNLNKVDESMIITAIVAPPAAMVAKKAGQKVPQLTFMNAIPDVVFVPSATILAFFATKILRLMFMGKTKPKDETGPHMQPAPTTKQDPQSTSEQKPQSVTTPPTEPAPAIKQELQTTSEQEPQSTTTPPIEPAPEPAIKQALQTTSEQEPQNTTTPPIEPAPVSEPAIKQALQTTSEQEPQSTTTPPTEPEPEPAIKQELQTTSEQELQTTTTPSTEPAPEIKHEPQTAIEPEQPTTSHPPGHTHKHKTFCALCNTFH